MNNEGQDDERYKCKGLQFTSATDSRALRAIQRRAGQKSRRDDAITLRRQIGSLEDSVNESHTSMHKLNFSTLEEKPKRKSLEELGRERYQQLLLWKEDKKKRLEKEKQLRKPAFKTGVFQPDAPKFLVSGDGENLCQTVSNTPGRPTPFKFLVRSSQKSGVTPGTSTRKPFRFCTGVTPGANGGRVPTFHTGVTPDQTLQRSGILARNKLEGSAKPAHRTRAALRARGAGRNEVVPKKGIRGRPSKTMAEDLGVKPLPRTPQALQRPQLPSRKPSNPEPSSFAPSDFTFEFNVQRALSLLKSCTEDEPEHEQSPPKRRRSKRSSVYSKKEEEKKVAHEEILSSDAVQISQEESDDAGSTGTYILGDQCIGNIESVQENDVPLTVAGEGLEEVKQVPEEVEEKEEEELVPEEVEEKEEEELVPEEFEEEKEEHELVPAENEKIQTEEHESLPAEVKEQQDDETIGEVSHSQAFIDEKAQKRRSVMKDETEELNIKENELWENPEDDDCVSNVSEALNLHLSPEKQISKRRSSKAKTPAKRITRRSIACCGEGLTPIASRLRPRTPCSRSTRRSLSAHCDSPVERIFTPLRQTSARRSTRRSVGSALKQKNSTEASYPEVPKFSLPEGEGCAEQEKEALEEMMEPLESVTEMEEIPEKVEKERPSEESQFLPPTMTPSSGTPLNRSRRSKVSWMVEGSPWINDNRRSSQKKKRRSGVPADIKALFDDIPTDGSPLPAHLTPESMRNRDLGASPFVAPAPSHDSPMTVNSSVHEDQTCSNLLALLQPMAGNEHVDSPDIDVWGDDSPAVGATAVNDVHCTPVTSKNTNKVPLMNVASPSVQYMDTVKEQENPGILSEANSSNKIPGDRRKSRRSVMFAVQDQENVASTHFRFPGTPIRASTRVSMGLFAKVDTNTEVLSTEGQDLMGFDSPHSEKKTTATRRKSSRISLLPGMEHSPTTKGNADPIIQDLISWETPMENKRRRSRRSAASTMVTPRRQSRRVSKAPVL